MPFVGSVSFFATPTSDSTHVLVAISIANGSLTFAREGDRFRAGYTVGISLKSGVTDAVKPIEAHEAVVVSSFKETTRSDESVLFEEIITVAPGRYEFAVSVRDDGSARISEDAVALAVPAVQQTGLSTPVSFARAGIRSRLTVLPQVVANPTAGATFGRDTVIPFFLEAYGQGDSSRMVQFAVRAENGRAIYRDSAALGWRGQLYAGTVSIPIGKVGIGAMTLGAWVAGRTDTVRAPLFVGFGGDLPLASYEEMLTYLRWFAPAYRLQALRDTAPEFRPAAWTAFVRDHAGPDGTSDAFRDYFARMLEANTRFREEAAPGWQTDRGKVLLGLGRPDQVYEQIQRSMTQQGRIQNWEYRAYNLALTFYDQNGFGRWKLTTASESEFMAAWRRRVQ
jgi:GWxTD domain-containing protein